MSQRWQGWLEGGRLVSRYAFSSAADADQFHQRFGGRRLTVTFKGSSTRPIDVFANEPPAPALRRIA